MLVAVVSESPGNLEGVQRLAAHLQTLGARGGLRGGPGERGSPGLKNLRDEKRG